MKRLMVTLAAGAFGTLLLVPIAHAQDWGDRYNRDYGDENYEQQRNINHDKQEQLEDLEHGNIGGAVRDQGEIEQRRQEMNENRENGYDYNDGNRYNRDYDDND